MNSREKFEFKLHTKRFRYPENPMFKGFLSNSDRIAEKISLLFGNLRNKRILDCGCGYGRIASRLADKNAIVFGIDIRNKEIDKSRQMGNITNVFTIVADGSKLPFKSNVYDGFVSISTLEHVEKPFEYAQEMSRVLKRNGLFCITATNALRIDKIKKRLKAGIYCSILTPLQLKKLLCNTALDFCAWQSTEKKPKLVRWAKSYFAHELVVIGSKKAQEKHRLPVLIYILSLLAAPIYSFPSIKNRLKRNLDYLGQD